MLKPLSPKTVSLVLAFLLGLSLFGTSAFSYSDCGKSCCCLINMQGMHHSVEVQARLVKNCCSTVSSYPCGLQSKQRIELPACNLSGVRADNHNHAERMVVSRTIISPDNFSSYLSPWCCAQKITQSSPLYLQNRSLLI